MAGQWCGPFGRHLLTVTYSRPWRAWFRVRYTLRCFGCDLAVPWPSRVPCRLLVLAADLEAIMRMTFTDRAAEHERFAPHAFDGLVRKQVPYRVQGVEIGTAKVVSVEVADDGRSAQWTVDVEIPGAGEIPLTSLSGTSFTAVTAPDDLMERWAQERRKDQG